PSTPVTSVRVKSLITSPAEGEVLRPGSHTVHGVAWSGDGPVTMVEVSAGLADGTALGRWTSAALIEPGVPHTWTHWSCALELPRAGFYVLRVRARDRSGALQPEHARWNYRGVGTNSWHAVPFEIRGEPTSTSSHGADE
ncbi:MAG TPA: hypothetical protein VIZ68_04380, partial [Thermoplasmata archaeon]